MRRIEAVLSILREKDGSVLLQEVLRMLKISQEELNKAISLMIHYGYVIESNGEGIYRLLKKPDRLYPWEIGYFLKTDKMGRKIIYRRVIDSTNKKAIQLARKGLPEGTCVIAEMQTLGKGRLGRDWFSPEGKNIYLSIILRPPLDLYEIQVLPFLSSLSVADTLESICEVKVDLKWPNDVLVKGKKISGSLIEISSCGKKVDFAILGIGLNVNMEESDLPESIRKIATSLFMETKRKHDRAYVCASLLNNLEAYYARLLEEGSPAILSLWQKKARIEGKWISVSIGERVIEGLCDGLEKDGALILKTKEGLKKVRAGDILS